MKTPFEILGLNKNKRGQLTVINLILLVVTLIVLIGMYPTITSIVAQGITGLTGDGLPSATNSIISGLLAFIPILIIIGYIVLALLYMRPNYGPQGGGGEY